MTIISIIVTLLIFSVIVVVHEYGHFIAARKNGILVEEFAVGMGPVLFSHKKGDTLYSIRAFPIGGFCKMLGEEDESNDPRAFSSKKVWQRIVVCIAGVVMNFLLAVVLGCVLISVTGVRTTVIEEVFDGTPAQAAGFMPGDKLLKINGKNIWAYEYTSFYLLANGGEKPAEVTFERNGSKMTVLLTPFAEEGEGGMPVYYMGVSMAVNAGVFSGASAEYTRAGFMETVKGAFGQSTFLITATVDSLSQLFQRKVDKENLMGPIGMGQMVDSELKSAAKMEESAFISFFSFAVYMAMFLSANLAVMNLLPIPALDGGRIVFLIIEGVRRRPIDPEKEGWIHLVGFALVIGLAIFVAFNDIRRIF